MSVDKDPLPGASDGVAGDKGSADAKNTPTKDEYVSRAELDEAIEARQAAKRKAREEADARKAEADRYAAEIENYKSRLREFEDIKRKAEDDEAAKRLDFEAIRKSAAEREAKLLSEAKEREAKLLEDLKAKDNELTGVKNKWLLEAEVLRVLGEVTIDPEASMLLIREKLELGQDDNGRYVPRIKDSVLNVKDFVEKNFEETGRAYMLKNQRKAGTGAPQQDAGSKSSANKSLTIDEINALPDRGASYFKDNPDAARAYLESFKIGSK